MKYLVLPLTLLLIASAGWAAADEKEPKTPEELNKADLEKMSGAWVVAKAETGGGELPKELFAAIVLTIEGEKYKVEGIPEGTDKGVVTIDATKENKEMTIKSEEGPDRDKVLKAIYKIEDDKLTVCYALSGDAFPKEFKTEADKPQLLLVYERKKKEEKKEKSK